MPRWMMAFLVILASGCATFHRPPGVRGPELDGSEARLAQALGHYGRGLVIEGEFASRSPAAVAEFARAATYDPGRYRLHARIAAAALLDRDPAKAAGALEDLCRLNPTSVVARTDLATVYSFMGQTARAHAALAEALALDPARALTYQEIAHALFAEGKDPEALDAVTVGLRRSATPAVLLAYLSAEAAGFIQQAQVPRAIACFERLVDVFPAHRREFLNLLGELYDTQGRPADAAAAYERAIASDPPLALSFVKLASLRMRTSAEDAMGILARGLQRLPDDAALLFAQAYIHVQNRRYTEAVAVFKKMRARAADGPAHALAPSFYVFYGSVCEQAGLRDQAETIMLECIRLYPDTHEALNYVAYAWAERGERLGEACEHAQRALASEPDNGAYLDTLAWVFFRQRRYTDALAPIRRASELLADDATVADHLGDILAALGNVPQAVSAWKRSYQLNSAEKQVEAKLRAQGVDPRTLPPLPAAPPPAPAATP